MSTTQFKLLVFVFMALILFNLFQGLYFLVTGKGGGKNTACSLSWRIGLSFLLFLILVALKLAGIVEPHALNQTPVATPADSSADQDKKDEGKTLQQIQQQDDASSGRIRLKQ
jgi:hypothetical protein